MWISDFVNYFSQDKTFGMKNKKGTKQQKYVKMVQQQVMQGGPKSAKQVNPGNYLNPSSSSEHIKPSTLMILLSEFPLQYCLTE